MEDKSKTNQNQSKKAKLVDRLTEKDIMSNLHYTDLIAMFRRLGEKSIGGELYKALIYTDVIFGPEYTISTCKRLVAEPWRYDFVFPKMLGKIYAIKYFKKMHAFTEDKNYLNAIESYQDDLDSHVSNLAKQSMQEIKDEAE